MFRYLTAGESHGPALVGILDGLPAQLALDVEKIDATLRARQGGYGRGGRMKIETDRVEFLAGLRGGSTLGSPIAILVRNADFENVRALMDPLTGGGKPLTNPRPGHTDYAGAMKYRHRDLRNVLERASARETAMRVALGAICAQFLEALGIRTTAHVSQIGDVVAPEIADVDVDRTNESEVRCPDPATERKMIAAIDAAKAAGDTLGGAFTIRVTGVPVGVGANRQPDTRLDGVLAGALMAMQTVKAVEVGAGRDVAGLPGSSAHDHFTLDDASAVARGSNRAGGIEGGISNGQDIVLRVSVKPIPTLMKALPSVNLHEGTVAPASIVRSDVCVVPAASIVGEAMVRLALTAPILEKFGGDSIEETRDNLERAVRGCSSPFRTIAGPLTRHVALVGFMAAGKTTIGRHLARELGLPFVDTDESIVRLHGRIPELFAERGEAGFRAAELDAVREALSGPPCVIALGGGAVTHAPTRALVGEGAVRVYLQIPVESLVERLKRSRTIRPLVGERPTVERVREMLAPREPIYLESEIVVRGPRRSKHAFAVEIADRVRAFQK